MTEWNGIKVGNVYKRTGRGSRGAPLAMVVSIEQYRFVPARFRGDSGELLESAWTHADVTMMVNGRLRVFDVRHHAAGTSTCRSWDESLRWAGDPELVCGADRRDCWARAGGLKWPYKALA